MQLSKQQAVEQPLAWWPANYEQGEKIGEGTYGVVYLTRSKQTGKRIALKQFKPGKEFDGLSHDGVREINLVSGRHVQPPLHASYCIKDVPQLQA